MSSNNILYDSDDSDNEDFVGKFLSSPNSESSLDNFLDYEGDEMNLITSPFLDSPEPNCFEDGGFSLLNIFEKEEKPKPENPNISLQQNNPNSNYFIEGRFPDSSPHQQDKNNTPPNNNFGYENRPKPLDFLLYDDQKNIMNLFFHQQVKRIVKIPNHPKNWDIIHYYLVKHPWNQGLYLILWRFKEFRDFNEKNGLKNSLELMNLFWFVNSAKNNQHPPPPPPPPLRPSLPSLPPQHQQQKNPSFFGNNSSDEDEDDDEFCLFETQKQQSESESSAEEEKERENSLFSLEEEKREPEKKNDQHFDGLVMSIRNEESFIPPTTRKSTTTSSVIQQQQKKMKMFHSFSPFSSLNDLQGNEIDESLSVVIKKQHQQHQQHQQQQQQNWNFNNNNNENLEKRMMETDMRMLEEFGGDEMLAFSDIRDPSIEYRDPNLEYLYENKESCLQQKDDPYYSYFDKKVVPPKKQAPPSGSRSFGSLSKQSKSKDCSSRKKGERILSRGYFGRGGRGGKKSSSPFSSSTTNRKRRRRINNTKEEREQEKKKFSKSILPRSSSSSRKDGLQKKKKKAIISKWPKEDPKEKEEKKKKKKKKKSKKEKTKNDKKKKEEKVKWSLEVFSSQMKSFKQKMKKETQKKRKELEKEKNKLIQFVRIANKNNEKEIDEKKKKKEKEQILIHVSDLEKIERKLKRLDSLDHFLMKV